MELFIQQMINGLSLGGIYALIALGYTMVYGIIELINFAHGDVYTLGSFFSIAIIGLLDASGSLKGVPLLLVLAVTLVGAMILCGIVGVLLERLAYRRLRNAPRLAPLITAIGASFILENIMQLWRGPSPIPFPNVVPNVTWHFGGVSLSSNEVLVVVTALALMAVLQIFIYGTRLGKAMRATAQDRDAAQLMGININMTIAL
ncbi:branched-chain amino acid ABC transporter permease, partial [bacterium]